MTLYMKVRTRQGHGGYHWKEEELDMICLDISLIGHMSNLVKPSFLPPIYIATKGAKGVKMVLDKNVVHSLWN